MIRIPGRPVPQETQRWLDELRGDAGWAPEQDPGADGHGPAPVPQPRRPAGDQGGPAERETQGPPGPGWRPALAEVPRQAPVAAAWQDPRPPARRGEPAAHGGSRRLAGAGHRDADPLLHPVPLTERPVIGDHLRLPLVWCQSGRCIARHADPAALGEADARVRAIAAGWCADAFGRLICPACQRSAEYFWISQPVVRWDRGVAFAMTSLIAAATPEDAVGVAGAETGVLPATPPVPPRAAAVVADGGPQGTGRHRRHH